MDQERKDFFISYTGADEQVAAWIAWMLEDAGYKVVFQPWDFNTAGRSVIGNIHEAIIDCERTIAVLSPDYFKSRFTRTEWETAIYRDPEAIKGLLIPIIVRDCAIDGILSRLSYISFIGLEEDDAKHVLLNKVKRVRAKPASKPNFKKEVHAYLLHKPRFPGTLPRIWNLPRRNPNFTGRNQFLKKLRISFSQDQNAALKQLSLHGLGGIGKSQLAIEYAYRHSASYECVWWIRAEKETSLITDYTALATKLDLAEQNAKEQAIIAQAVKDWLDTHNGWLLIFDNAVDAEIIRDFLPRSSGGHVLITSRNPYWKTIGSPLTVSVWDREESISFLQKRTGQNNNQEANKLAEALGDLPLALEQAGAYIDAKCKKYIEYLSLFNSRRKDLWESEKNPDNYLDTVATTWRLALEEIESVPMAKDMLYICSMVSPNNIPVSLLQGALRSVTTPTFFGKIFNRFLDKKLKLSSVDTIKFDNAIEALRRYSLITSDISTVSVHRLVQVVVQDRMEENEIISYRNAIITTLQALFPHEGYSSTSCWPKCESLFQHAEAAMQDDRDDYDEIMSTRAVLLSYMGGYLNGRGLYSQAELLYRRVLKIAEKGLGKKHPEFAACLNGLGVPLLSQGKYPEAEQMFRQALEIQEKRLGKEHPDFATTLNNLSILLYQQGRYNEIKPLISQALLIQEKRFGKKNSKLASILTNLAALLKSEGKYTESELLYQQALNILESTVGTDHPDYAISLNSLAILLKSQGKYTKAEQIYRQVLEIQERTKGKDHPDIAASLNNLAELLRVEGKYMEAESLYYQAIDIQEKYLGKEHPHVAISLNNLALWLQSQGKYPEAETYLRRSLDILEKNKEIRNNQHVSMLQNNLASVLEMQAKYSEAEQLYRRALKVMKEHMGDTHPDVAINLNNLAGVLQKQGKHADAEPLYRLALQISENAYGNEHPYLAKVLNNLATSLDDQGKYAEAEPFYWRSLEISEIQFGKEHPEVATSLHNLATLMRQQGKYNEAETLLRRALSILEKELEANHPFIATSMSNLAGVLHDQGKYEQAELFFRQALEFREKQLGPEHPDVAVNLNNLATLLHDQGKIAEVVPLYLRALQIYEKQLGHEHVYVASSLNNLALIFNEQGIYDEAKSLYLRALQIYEKQLGADHPSVATSLNNLAQLLSNQGKYTEAEPFYKRAEQILEKSLGDSHPQTITIRENLEALHEKIKDQRQNA